MFTIITLVHLAFATGVHSSFAKNECENLANTVKPPCHEPSEWSIWRNDEKRMTWWHKNGWRILEGQKPGEEAGSFEITSSMSEQWSPLDIGLFPDEKIHLAYTINEDKTLVLYSLQRCETLYLRSLLANPN